MENNNLNTQNNEYYSKKSDKLIDFLIGYFGFFVLKIKKSSDYHDQNNDNPDDFLFMFFHKAII